MSTDTAARNGVRDVPMTDGSAVTPVDSLRANEPIGPNPGGLKVSHQYLLEQRIRKKLDRRGADLTREARLRLEGVQLIDSVREKLQLPAKTYNAACTFYHKLRLRHPNDYNHLEAAMACLFTACKVEDTHKKSRDLACARWNLQNPDNQLTQDDKTFDVPSKSMISIERQVLESLRFDFRVRNPQKIIAKLVKYHMGSDEHAAKDFFAVAYAMSFDLYKTLVPIKHTTFAMSLAVVELTALLTRVRIDDFRIEDPSVKWHTERGVVLECLLDLLDLYTLAPKSTRVGLMFDLDAFIDIKIKVNNELEQRGSPRYRFHCDECAQAAAPPSPSTGSEKEGTSAITSPTNGVNNLDRAAEMKARRDRTTRFVFDVDEAYRERDIVKQHTEDQYEEHEIEVEETIPEDIPDRPRGPRAAPRGPRGRGAPSPAFGGAGRGGGMGFDSGWIPGGPRGRGRGGPRGGMSGGMRGGPGYF